MAQHHFRRTPVTFNITGCPVLQMHGFRGSAATFYLTGQKRKCVLVCAEARQMIALKDALSTYNPTAGIFSFPPLDGSPFGFTPTHPSVRRDRLRCLAALQTGQWDFVVTTGQAIMNPIAPDEKLIQPKLDLVVGEPYDLTELTRQLVQMGYLSTDVVAQPGDFARRGGILDVYDFATETAIRLDFFDDELDEIRIDHAVEPAQRAHHQGARHHAHRHHQFQLPGPGGGRPLPHWPGQRPDSGS